jgi:hypothetical protein
MPERFLDVKKHECYILDLKIFEIKRGEHMQPIDNESRRVIAADRFERLRRDAEGTWGGAASARVRLGNALIAAGVRLSRAEAAPRVPCRARAARPW